MNITTARGTLVRAGTGLTLAAALLLASCASDDPAAFEDTEQTSTDEQDGGSAQDAGAEADGGGAPGEPVEDADGAQPGTDDGADQPARDVTLDPQEAQQTATYPLPGADGEMTMGLHSLEAGEEGLLLTVSLMPEYEEGDGPLTMYHLHDRPQMSGHNAYVLPALNDRDNFKAYYVPTPEPRHRTAGWVGRSTEAWATDVEGVPISSGDVFMLWAYFPLPEDDIDTIDVAVIPGAPEFADVEIDWGEFGPADYGDSGGSDDSGDSDGEDE